MPTPEELRTKAAAAREAKKKRAERIRREEATQLRKDRKAVIDTDLPGWIRYVDNNINNAADGGLLTTTVGLGQVSSTDRNVKLYKPAWDKLVEHYQEQGYVVQFSYPGGVSYCSDGAGPDGYLYPEIKLDWSDE